MGIGLCLGLWRPEGRRGMRCCCCLCLWCLRVVMGAFGICALGSGSGCALDILPVVVLAVGRICSVSRRIPVGLCLLWEVSLE